MRLLVTGGAGFIGSNFIDYWLECYPEDEILCYDKLTYAGSLANLAAARAKSKFHFLQGDICDKEKIEQILAAARPDVLVNFAAESHVDRSIAAPEIFLTTNLLGVEVLLSACYKYAIERFHQVSTDEVYGSAALEQEKLRFGESATLQPSSPYAASKAAADLLVLAFRRTYALPVTISRSCNNYGARQYPEKLIPKMIMRALTDAALPLYGNGENRRDWLYVGDHCRALAKIIRCGKAGEIYNVAAHNELSNSELIKLILRELGKPESLITHVSDRPGHDWRYGISTEKIESELGWQAQMPFMKGLKQTIAYYRAQVDLCKYSK